MVVASRRALFGNSHLGHEKSGRRGLLARAVGEGCWRGLLTMLFTLRSENSHLGHRICGRPLQLIISTLTRIYNKFIQLYYLIT